MKMRFLFSSSGIYCKEVVEKYSLNQKTTCNIVNLREGLLCVTEGSDVCSIYVRLLTLLYT